MIKIQEILPFEICDAFQNFLSESAEFETFLNTKGYTNKPPVGDLKRISYVHYPKNTLAIDNFPFITLSGYESEDIRTEEDGFRWKIEIEIGVKDLVENMEKAAPADHENVVDENVKKYTKASEVQEIAKQIIATIGEEIEISGVKSDFNLKFGKIAQSTAYTGEFDPMYHGIELEIISFKEI